MTIQDDFNVIIEILPLAKTAQNAQSMLQTIQSQISAIPNSGDLQAKMSFFMMYFNTAITISSPEIPKVSSYIQQLLQSIIVKITALSNANEVQVDIDYLKTFCSTLSSNSCVDSIFMNHMKNALTVAGFGAWVDSFQILKSIQLGLSFWPSPRGERPVRDNAIDDFANFMKNVVPNLSLSMQSSLAPYLKYYSNAIDNNGMINMSDYANYNLIMDLIHGPHN